MLPRQHFIRRLHDGVRLFLIQQPQRTIDQRSGAFGFGECHDDFFRHPLGRYMEVL